MKDLFKQHNFWVAALTIFVLAMKVVIPEYSLDVEHTAAVVGVLIAYMIAYQLDPSGFNFGSRRLWVSVFGAAVVFLDSFHVFPSPLDVQTLGASTGMVMVYVIAVGKDPGNGWTGLVVSRKFWTFVISILIVFLKAFNLVLPGNMTPDQLVELIAVFGAYILTVAFGKVPVAMPDPEVPEE